MFNDYNTNDDTFKKSKSSQIKLNLNKEKIIEKNISETVLIENSKINRLVHYYIEEEKKDNLFKPNEKWMTSSKIKIDNNKKLDIPRFQLNT